MNNELVKVENDTLVATPEGIKLIKKVQKAKVQLNMMEEELKQCFLDNMEKNNITRYISPDGTFKATYYKASTSTGLNTKKLKEEEPAIYDKYQTITPKKAYVKFS